MNRQQLKYFLELNPDRRKRALAKLLVDYLKVFESVKNDDFDKRMEEIREQLLIVDTGVGEPEVEGVNPYLVGGEDLIKLLSLDEHLADLIWDLEIARKKLNQLISQSVEKIEATETTT